MAKVVVILMMLFTISPPLSDEHDWLRDEIKSSETIVVAEVLEVKPSMGVWSGLIASTQCVRYLVKTTLKGDEVSGEIDVGHFVVSNSYTADKDSPRLSPILFKKGNQLVLMLKSGRKEHHCQCLDSLNIEGPSSMLAETKGKSFTCLNENYGVRPASPDFIEFVRKTLGK
jgi:hypothetical protein